MDSGLLLGHSADWWNGLMLISLVVVALAGAFVAAATTGAVVAIKRETLAANNELSRYKLETGKTIAETNERAEVARLDAANARLEQEKLKNLVRWRTIEPATMKILVAELAKGGGEIDMAFAPSDPEAEYFALAILGEAFKKVNGPNGPYKWRVNLRPWTSSKGMFFGIAIPGPNTGKIKFLREAFTAAHIIFTIENPPEETSPIAVGAGLKYTPPPSHEALIVVGLKQPTL